MVWGGELNSEDFGMKDEFHCREEVADRHDPSYWVQGPPVMRSWIVIKC